VKTLNRILKHPSFYRALPLAILLTFIGTRFAFAQEGEPVTADYAYYAIDNMMLFIAAVLVLFMQAGFAMLEAGLNSAKNTVNILFKNFMDMSVGVLIYFAIGYSLMYGAPALGGFLGWSGFGIASTIDPAAIGPGALSPQVDWLFQVAFAATAATIVSGAVAGRMQFRAYLVYSVFITALVYPISGYWKWGGGWLDQLGFYDFAGSLVVHSVGGFAGLAGAILLGPRIGRFNKDGTSNPMPAHSLSLATLGVFILWIGWYGFNPGSQLAFAGSANTNIVMLIAANTTLAAAAGAVFAMIVAWFFLKKPDLGMTLNGALAGLVGITANCDSVTNGSAIIIGLVAGFLVVIGVFALEKVKIDDPVGAWPVHGLCGIWGGLATGIFGGHPLGAQIIGSLVIPIWAFVTCFALFYVLKSIGILRVSAEEEIEGLDLSEHGVINYPEFGPSVVNTQPADSGSAMPAR
jgi:Amt family ammonium transporter